jgi:hypothetical protein
MEKERREKTRKRNEVENVSWERPKIHKPVEINIFGKKGKKN